MTNYRIFVNGNSKSAGSWVLSYEQIVSFAFGTLDKSTPSVTYHDGVAEKPEGILLPGQTVRGNHDMKFDVAHTGNA